MNDRCLRRLQVTSTTAASRPTTFDRVPDTVYLCLRPLPCDNPQHEPERMSND